MRASRVLTYSSRGEDWQCCPFSRDPTCPAGNEGWDGTARGWTRRSARYRDILEQWSLGRYYKAIVAGWWRRRPSAPGWIRAMGTRPQKEEVTNLLRSWWGRVICQYNYSGMSDDFKHCRGCLEPAAATRLARTRSSESERSAKWSTDRLDPVLCGTAVDQPWLNTATVWNRPPQRSIFPRFGYQSSCLWADIFIR